MQRYRREVRSGTWASPWQGPGGRVTNHLQRGCWSSKLPAQVYRLIHNAVKQTSQNCYNLLHWRVVRGESYREVNREITRRLAPAGWPPSAPLTTHHSVLRCHD